MPRRLQFPQQDRISVILTSADRTALRSQAEKQGKTISILLRELITSQVAHVA